MKQIERFSKACNKGKLDLAKEIYQKYGHLIRIEKYYSSGELFLDICLQNNIDVAKWLLSVAEVKDPTAIYEALATAIMFGRLTFVSWLFSELYGELCKVCVMREECEMVYKIACKHKHLDIVNYFRLVLHGQIDFERSESATFETAVKDGCLSIIEFIISLNPNICDRHSFYDYNFLVACGKGHLDIVEYLHTKLYIKSALYYGFLESCTTGHLDIAQWLLPMAKPLFGSNNGQNEYACYIEVNQLFRYVCEKGHLEVAKWLYEIFDDIDLLFFNGECFKYACTHANASRKFLEMAEWLASLNPYLFEITYDNYGKVFKSQTHYKKEMKWRQRRYPLWLASDESPNKRCLLYRIPEDVSRHIISSYL